MPLIIDQDEAKAHMNAWLTALPSQVNDSFYQLYQPSDNTPSSLRRVVAFEVDQEDMKKFAKDTDGHLEIDYGFNREDLGKGQSAFKMYIRSVGGKGENDVARYHSMKSLSTDDIKNQYPEAIQKSLFAQNQANNVETMNTPGGIPNEYISPTIEQWLFYTWRNCETAYLIDQVEAMYQDSRVRIRKSIFDPNINKAESKIERSKNAKIYTFVLLALHQVIPGDMRMFHFGPILLSFVAPISETQELASFQDTQTIQPVSYELTVPCPPLCQG